MKSREIIILHGWNLSGSRFSPLADALKKLGYRVFCPDMPGFGKEPPPARAWHVVDYAEFVHGVVAKNRIRHPVIIGHSFGGRVALKYAQLYPEMVHALILTGAPGFSPVPQRKMFVFLLAAKAGGLLFSVPPLNLFADWARRWLYYTAGARDFLRVEGQMRQTFKYIVQDSLVSAMEALRVPCLLLWGEYDVIVPVAIARRMQEVVSGSVLTIIPEADHGVPFKEPEIFAGYADSFIRKS